MGGAVHVIKNGGLFILSDERVSDKPTFDTCIVVGGRGVGGGLYIRNFGGLLKLGGSSLSFSDVSTSALFDAEIFFNADSFEEAFIDRVIIDGNSDISDSVVGILNDNFYSFIPFSYYFCVIENKYAEQEVKVPCVDPPDCDFDCPSGSVKSLNIIFYFLLTFFF
jgi:hypothetical protein